MTEEKINVVADEKKECNCPVCKVLKSDCTKKFLAVVLASFIGCSLAILVFAPKKHHPMPRYPHAPYMRMMDRPMPPAPEFRGMDRTRGHEFRGECYKYPEFRDRGHRPHQFRGDVPHKPEFRKDVKNFPCAGEYKGKFNGKYPEKNKDKSPNKPVGPDRPTKMP